MVAGAQAGASGTTAVGEAERLDAIRRRILNVVGHELRTPVTTIRGLAESLDTADAQAIRSTIAPALVRNTRRLERLLDDLLIASGITTALPVDLPEVVAPAPLARETWARLADAVGGADLEIVSDAPDVDAVEALIPPASLRSALERVFENALRYGEPPFRLEITRTPDAVRLTLDTPGAALHREEIQLALEPFFRGEQAVMTHPGLGLGLSVAQALLDRADGRVWVEDRPGGGLVTVLEVPAL